MGNDQVATLVELPLPPGNVAVSPGGRIFFDLHPSARPGRFSAATVFEYFGQLGRPPTNATLDAGAPYRINRFFPPPTPVPPPSTST